jgi:hypothetical protein
LPALVNPAVEVSADAVAVLAGGEDTGLENGNAETAAPATPGERAA